MNTAGCFALIALSMLAVANPVMPNYNGRPHRLNVTVQDAVTGRPIPGASVRVGDTRLNRLTDRVGSVSCRGPVTLNSQVTAYAPGFALVYSTLQDVANGRAIVTVGLAPIAPRLLAGRVTDGLSGTPVAGARISCGGLSTRTDATGSFTLRAVCRSGTELRVSHDTLPNCAAEFSPGRGETTAVRVLLYGPRVTGQVYGRVTDAGNGQVLANAAVYIAPWKSGASTGADRDGYYRLEGLTPGTHRVAASFVGYNDVSREVIVEPNRTTTLNIQFGI